MDSGLDPTLSALLGVAVAAILAFFGTSSCGWATKSARGARWRALLLDELTDARNRIRNVDVEPGDLRDGERQTFWGTNIDYTFGDDRDCPLFPIEFDGIGGGYSWGGEYRQARPTSDPNRKR